MSLDKPPPSRYRIEEKNGQLIVHDSMAAVSVSSPAPQVQPRSALDAAGLAAPAPPQPARSSIADSAKAKRGGIIAVIGIFVALFLIFTGLWPIMALAFIIAPVRRQLLGSVVPAVKRFVEEGRWS